MPREGNAVVTPGRAEHTRSFRRARRPLRRGTRDAILRVVLLDHPSISVPDAAPRRWSRRRLTAAAAAVVGVLLTGALILMRTHAVRPTYRLSSQLHDELEAWLSDRLATDVHVGDVEVTFGPEIRVEAHQLTLRIPGRPDLPPFVTVDTWSGTARLDQVAIRHFDEVRLSGVTITVPPRRLADFRATPRPGRVRGPRRPPAIAIDRLVADRVALAVLSRDGTREPHLWDIRDLKMAPFSFDEASPFSATVDTPLPSDRAVVTGTAGPWPRGDFDQLPLSGTYTFAGTLSDVPGLRGAISVEGRALGTLDRLATAGRAWSTAAGFVSGESAAMPLEVSFEALFDATNSDIRLSRVDARAGDAVMRATGHVVRSKGARGRHVALHTTSPASSDAGDLLRLFVDAEPPALGGLAMEATVDLPPGDGDVLNRLTASGTFDLQRARFTNPRMQDVLDDLASKGLGRPGDPLDRVKARLRGTLRLANRELAVSLVRLGVPGVSVEGAGGYSLRTQRIGFRGVTRLDARLSQTQRGMRRWLLKPFNGLLAHGGAGTRLVLDIRGSRRAPIIDLDLGASLRGSQ